MLPFGGLHLSVVTAGECGLPGRRLPLPTNLHLHRL